MQLTFTKATKEQAKLRLSIFGPSGSGKTYTALRLATGIGGPIALIDTERGSASKYADRFEFDALTLPQNDINTYCTAIAAAGREGYNVLIIDSLTHGWRELLAEVDRLAKSKYRGNTWSAWSEGTPKQTQLVDALLDFDGHIIATMRTKTEWSIETDDRGKTKPVRIGLAPEQGKGIEYEFDLLMEISPDHIANVIKDRTGKYQDQVIDKPGEDLGRELAAWLKEGAAPTPRPKPDTSPRSEVERGAPTPAQPAPRPAKAPAPQASAPAPSNGGNGHGEPPARKPADLLKVVNGRLEIPYDNLFHLGNTLKAELGKDWSWPNFNNAEAWQAAYDAAMKHGKAKSAPAPEPAKAAALEPKAMPKTDEEWEETIDTWFPPDESLPPM
jgi:hypothetical protein